MVGLIEWVQSHPVIRAAIYSAGCGLVSYVTNNWTGLPYEAATILVLSYVVHELAPTQPAGAGNTIITPTANTTIEKPIPTHAQLDVITSGNQALISGNPVAPIGSTYIKLSDGLWRITTPKGDVVNTPYNPVK